MEFRINVDKLSNSLKNESTKKLLINENIIKQISGYILMNNKDCIMLAGYRGVGKTCIIDGLQSSLAKEKIIFIKLNCTEYQSKNITIRKLIREIYLELSRKNTEVKCNNDKYKDLINKSATLYEKTFYEITHSNHTTTRTLKKVEAKIKVDVMKLIKLLVLPTLFYINAVADFFRIPNYIPLLIYGVSIAILFIKLFEIVGNIVKSKEDIEEVDRKSLYDEEIAEYHLRDIFNDLDQLDYTVIIVLDELDKIDDNKQINKILSDFKPLFLSKLANFIIISGQQMYYELMNSVILEDAIISSIFSKSYYVDLPDFTFFDDLLHYAIESKVMQPKILKTYNKSKILKSNWVVRRFINSIIQDTCYENNRMYIKIDKDYMEKLNFDSKLFDIGMHVYTDTIKKYPYISQAEKNFYKYQLFLWVNRIINTGGNTFTSDYISDASITLDNILSNLVLSRMKENLIKLFIKADIINEKAENENIVYEYIGNKQQAEMKKEIVNSSTEEFMHKMRDMLKYYRYINNLNDDYRGELTFDRNFFNKIDDQTKVYFDIYNKILNGDSLSDSEVLNINNADYRMLRPTHLIEDFLVEYSKHYFEKFKYDISRNSIYNDNNYDFTIYPYNSKNNCYVEIKYIRFFSQKIIENIRHSIMKFENKSSLFLIILYFSDYCQYINIEEKIKSQFKEINPNIKIITMSEELYLREDNLDIYYNQIYSWLNFTAYK